MKKTFQHIVKLLQHDEPFVLVTILTRLGSAPRTAGTRMIVRKGGSTHGTIGGGALEADVIKTSVELFSSHRSCVKEFSLTGGAKSTMDMICGGEVEVLIDYVDPSAVRTVDVFTEAIACIDSRKRGWLITAIPDAEKTSAVYLACEGDVDTAWPHGDALWGELKAQARGRYPVAIETGAGRFLVEPLSNNGTVYVFGGGHISQHLAMLTTIAGFRTVVLDDREAFANRKRFPIADDVVVQPFEKPLEGLAVDGDSFIVIVTRGHLHDKSVLGPALRGPACYVGMIGSRKKRDAIYAALKAEGFSDEDLQRVHAPIGLSIGAESPEEVAISIVAELIKVRSER